MCTRLVLCKMLIEEKERKMENDYGFRKNETHTAGTASNITEITPKKQTDSTRYEKLITIDDFLRALAHRVVNEKSNMNSVNFIVA